MLDDEGSYIHHKASGKKINIVNHNGEFKFGIWVPKAQAERQVKEEPVRRRNGNAAIPPEPRVAPDESASGNKRQRLEEIGDDDDQLLDMLFVGHV